MEVVIHGAERCSTIPKEQGQSIQYTFHQWRRGSLAVSDEKSLLIFDLRQMRAYAFIEGFCLVHKITGAVSNQTQGRLILWVKLTDEKYALSVKQLSMARWQHCVREIYPFQGILKRLLFYLWYATTF